MSLPVKAPGKDVALPFQWRDKFGTFHSVKDMETRHLFFTLRMIWNNSCPEEARVGTVRLYRFEDFYTAAYVRDAVKYIYKELWKRDDITQEWMDQLHQMEQWFGTYYKVVDDLLIGSSQASARVVAKLFN